MRKTPLTRLPDPRQVIRGYFVVSLPPKSAEISHFYGKISVQTRKLKIDFIGLTRDWIDVRVPSQRHARTGVYDAFCDLHDGRRGWQADDDFPFRFGLCI